MSGNMMESKKAKFDIWRTENNVIIPDVKFSLSLNHSRLLSSSLEWRIDLKDNIVVSDVGVSAYCGVVAVRHDE